MSKMNSEGKIKDLSGDIIQLWNKISKDIKKDLAYIWDNQEEVAVIEKDVEDIAKEIKDCLKKLISSTEIREIKQYAIIRNRLIAHLKHIEAKRAWFEENRKDLAAFLSLVQKFNEESLHSKTELTKPNSGRYLKKINNANSEQIQKIIFFIERELKWLDSDEYILRKKEATGMSESKIKKDIQKIKEQLAKTEINFLDEKAYLLTAVYSQNKKNPIINVFKTDNEGLTLNAIDHEIKHAVSEQALEFMDDLIKLFRSNYRRYPKLKIARKIDYLIFGQTAGNWSNNAPEQQVVSKRIMDIMETDYGIKRGAKLTIDDLKKLVVDLNHQMKKGDERNSDIIILFYKMKQKLKESYKYKLCEMVNKAY